ncbi:oxidoreductase [Candidatus Xianfuyuplasma coldseepsis]|uniref:SDR family NAD(P)-dependent oxidoreductase n=1 Tax=Candidatus Xianfuyuplasma coldseepsis TaxID=2782163 RepID=A0A7L7KPU7_9MOLU|nr:oxidoreductase [Xianfuyuplasma coldseepsis]QMS84595.1 SDR family NAD(P)-dependent oxidoreductase [Xianfuyuplasma coldseepsis]
MKWTEQDMPDLSGKVIVVTGANSGIGYEATRLFAKKNAEVIMACRNREKAEAAFDTIKQDVPTAKLVIIALDLASFSSIHKFSDELHKRYQTIDILLNNAGIMMTPYRETADGLEQQQGINHFGHFLLTSLLFDLLKQSNDPRIVNISSIAHRFGTMNFKNLQYKNKKGYVPFLAYGRSKLENLLFTYHLANNVEQAGLSVKVLAAHPGISSTNLGNHIYERGVYKAFHALTNKFTQSAYQGSLPGVRAAVDPMAQNGQFYGPDKLFGVKGAPVVCTSTKRSHNRNLQQQLWDYSLEVTYAPFTF